MEQLAIYIAGNAYLQSLAIFIGISPGIFFLFKAPSYFIEQWKGGKIEFTRNNIRFLLAQRTFVKRDLKCGNLQHFRLSFQMNWIFVKLNMIMITLITCYFAIYSINNMEIQLPYLSIILKMISAIPFFIAAYSLILFIQSGVFYSLLGIRITSRKLGMPSGYRAKRRK